MKGAVPLHEGLAVEGIVHAAHALLIAVVDAGHAGDGELQHGAKPLQHQGLVQGLLGEFHLQLILPAQRAQPHIGGQGGAEPLHIVGAQQVHQGIVHGLGVIHLLGDEELPQGISVRLPMHEGQHRAPEGVIHHRIQRGAQGVAPAAAVALLDDRVLPDLTDDGRVGLDGLGGGTDQGQHIVRQLVGHIQAPAGGPVAQPELHHTVLPGDNILLPGGVFLVHLRQVLEAPPAAVLIGIFLKIIPVVIRRILALAGPLAGIAAIAVEIAAVRPGVGIDAVQNQADAQLLRPGTEVLKVLHGAQDGVGPVIVRGIIAVVGAGFHNGV